MSGEAKAGDLATFARALDIVQRLQAGQRLSASRLSAEYNVSLRQAQRLMAASGQTLPVRRIGSGNTEPYLVWCR